MNEKRKYGRLGGGPSNIANIYSLSLNKEVIISDISAGGMKVLLSQELPQGASVYGEVTVIPQIGPFYVRGRVIRVTPKDNQFETAIKFENVCTIQSTVEFADQVDKILHQ